MSKNLNISILLDFYGSMLTEKQQNLMALYYNEDLSLSEIAELSGITRQGVQDSLRRCAAQLTALEEKLQLVAGYYQTREAFEEIDRATTELQTYLKNYGSPKIGQLVGHIRAVAAAQLED